MSQERKERLEALAGWIWDARADQWEDGFNSIKEYVRIEGHARVPTGHAMPDGYKLGLWISNQRANKEDMSQERKDRLEALAGWAWNKIEDQWEEGFKHLEEYVRIVMLT